MALAPGVCPARARGAVAAMPSPTPPPRAPLLWLLLPLMAGIAVARSWPPPAGWLGPLLGVALLAALVTIHAARTDRPVASHLALMLAAGIAGFTLLPLRHPHLLSREERAPREATLELRVDELYAASTRSQGGLGVVTGVGAAEPEMTGQLTYFSTTRRGNVVLRPGARYRGRGVLEPLPVSGRTGFEDHLANLGVQHRLVRAQFLTETAPPGRWTQLLEGVRQRLRTILAHGLDRHPETAAVYRAMLLGEKAALASELKAAFLHSGTFHVFSVSGLHVGVIALALRELARACRVPGRAAAALTLTALGLYVQVTGSGAPSVRAWVMVAFVLASEVLRLPGNAFAALCAAALCLLLWEPLQLFQTGFQLSFTVVSGLLLFGAPLARRWGERWRPFALVPRPEWKWRHEAIDTAGRWSLRLAAGCWAAFLSSTAAGVGIFGIFSPGALLANLLVLPLSTLAIIAGFLSLLTGLIGVLAWSALFNAAAGLLLLITGWLLQHGTELPGFHHPASFRADWVAAAGMIGMTAVFLAGAALRWRARCGGFWPPVVFLILLLLLGMRLEP